MTLKLTERDKKLLVFLAIFLIIVGIGAGVIYPLFTWSKSLDEELSTQKQLQVENEQKVSRVITMEMGKKEMEQEIEQTRKEFYSMMDSDKIDKMLTEYALSRSVTVTNLDISMPKSGSYTQLADYSQGDSTNNTGDTEAGTPTYNGVYTASIQISMSGSQDALQGILDYWSKQEPKLRVTEFVWENRSQGETTEAYRLSMGLELYMAQDTDEYLQQSAAAAEQAAQQAALEQAAAQTTTN